MVLDHAPVTGLAILFSSISAVLTKERYNRPPHRLTFFRNTARSSSTMVPVASTFTHLRRLCLESIPFGGLGAGIEDICLTIGILVQMRTLERRWGSASFLSFLLSAAAVGVCALQFLSGPASSGTGTLLDVFVPASGDSNQAFHSPNRPGLYFTPEAVRVLTGAASLVPLTALVARYMLEIPSSSANGDGGFRIPGTALVLTDRVTFVLPLLKLIFAPNGVLQAPTHKRDGVFVTVGLWTRLLLAIAGLLFGLASARSPGLRWLLQLFAEKVCRPVLRFLSPVLVTPFFGSRKKATHVRPAHLQQTAQGTGAMQDFYTTAAGGGGGGSSNSSRRDVPHRYSHRGAETDISSAPASVESGRISVGSLSGAATATAAAPVDFARYHPAPRRSDPEEDGSSNSGRSYPRRPPAAAAAVSPAAVAHILEMGLGQSEEEVIETLRATGGDVGAAVNSLLSRS